jgi:hypothetical protein
VQVGRRSASRSATSMLRLTQLFNLTGHPAVSLPCGLSHRSCPAGFSWPARRVRPTPCCHVARGGRDGARRHSAAWVGSIQFVRSSASAGRECRAARPAEGCPGRHGLDVRRRRIDDVGGRGNGRLRRLFLHAQSVQGPTQPGAT